MAAVRISGSGTAVAEDAKAAHELVSRTRGLMFRKSLLAFGSKGAHGVIEMPVGSADAVKAGDLLEFDRVKQGTIVGKGGVPFGRMRIFGTGGANYHRATFTTTERIDTFPVTLQWRTEGWGLVFGGGAEVWINESFAIYGEFTRAMMTGEDVRNTEATTDAPITSIVVGGRYRFRGF